MQLIFVTIFGQIEAEINCSTPEMPIIDQRDQIVVPMQCLPPEY